VGLSQPVAAPEPGSVSHPNIWYMCGEATCCHRPQTSATHNELHKVCLDLFMALSGRVLTMGVLNQSENLDKGIRTDP
jgi:hypothetical protein